MDKILHQLIDFAWTLVVGITPAALGASVSLVYEKGLTWGDRFIRLAVGVIVSWFGQRFAAAVVSIDPFVLQGIGFTLGMIAYKATPAFMSSASDTFSGLPARLVARFLPAKKEGDE